MLIMKSKLSRALYPAVSCLLLGLVTASAAPAQDVTSSPTTWGFAPTYLGQVSGSKVFTVSNAVSKSVTISAVSFSCPEFKLSSGVAPIALGKKGTITHYSVFFQPDSVQSFSCNFVMTMSDSTVVNVPITGTGKSTTALVTVAPSSLTFPNQSLGKASAGQTITLTNSGTAAAQLTAITLSPPSFTTGMIALPATIAANSSINLTVFYTPSQVTSETGAIDLTYDVLPDNGLSVSGNGVAATALVISTSPTLPQATQSAAYQATLATSGGTGPYTWSLASGSTLPSGLTLSSAGVISGTLGSSVAAGTYTLTAKVTDTTTAATASSLLTLGVFANLKDNCADISFSVPNTSTPITALTDLGTGTYQGEEGGLYASGSNVRPSDHDSDGVAIAEGIQALDSNGNPNPSGKYVLLAVGESTAQNEFNRFLPVANADPTKNPNLVIVNGAQGGGTPANFKTSSSAYWATVTNDYLPQNNVTAKQVVAAWIEDTDGIATGSFPTDMTTMQGEYESMMQTMLTLFPNLKLVYFSSRVYGGYSNGVGSPDNPEPYAYEAGFAVKNAIQDQLNGKSSLNYDPTKGAVVAPWMSWGPYYWANGMLGRNDGIEWDCEDFSPDGTHPSSTFGQLKVGTALLDFLKTDDTTTPWYLAASFELTPTAGNGQSGNIGSTLPSPLTVEALNPSTGTPVSGVSVTFSDGGKGGTFGTPVAITDSNGLASTTYTLPATAQTVTITATSSGFAPASFTETATSTTATVATITTVSGGKQKGTVGTPLPLPIVMKATDASGNAVVGAPITFSDGGAGGSFSANPVTTDSSGQATVSYTLPTAPKTITITGSNGAVSNVTTAQSVAGAAATISIVLGNNQSALPHKKLAKALGVSVTDQFANKVAGATVTFTDNGAGGTFSSTTAVTSASGQASVTYTTGANAGTVSIKASTGTVTPVTFTETVQ
jgi:hypothetical protein